MYIWLPSPLFSQTHTLSLSLSQAAAAAGNRSIPTVALLLSLSLFVYLALALSAYLFIYLSLYLYIFIHILSLSPLSLGVSSCLFLSTAFASLCYSLFIPLSIYLSINLSISIYLSTIYLSMEPYRTSHRRRTNRGGGGSLEPFRPKPRGGGVPNCVLCCSNGHKDSLSSNRGNSRLTYTTVRDSK